MAVATPIMSALDACVWKREMMNWAEVDWLEVAGCLVIGVPALAIGLRHLKAGARAQGRRVLFWGLGMVSLAAAAVLESLVDGPAAIAGIAVAVVFFAFAVIAERDYRRDKTS
jgi:hypothetical protein